MAQAESSRFIVTRCVISLPSFCAVAMVFSIASPCGCRRSEVSAPSETAPKPSATTVTDTPVSDEPLSSASTPSTATSPTHESSSAPTTVPQPAAETTENNSPAASDQELHDALRDLVSLKPEIRNAAVDSINQMSVEQQGRIAEILATTSGDATTRRGAMFYLLGLPHSELLPLAPAIVSALSDPDDDVRAMAIQVVPQIDGADQEAATATLTKMLTNHDETATNRATVARTLTRLGKPSETTVAALRTAATSDPAPKVRIASCTTAGRITEPADGFAILQAVMKDDSDESVRRIAVLRMARYGPYTKVIEALSGVLADASPTVQEAAASSLANIGLKDATPIAAQLQSDQAATRIAALSVLLEVGPPARPHLDAVRRCLRARNAAVRDAAQQVLNVLEP